MACDDVLKELGSNDTDMLREAAFAAGEDQCEEAIPYLAGLLQSSNLGVQEAAEHALLKIGGGKVVRAVIPLLRSEDPPARNLSMEILRHLGDQDFPALIELLHDSDPDIRIFASDILGSTENFLAVPPLCEALLKDPEVNVRYQAAVSLGELAFPEAGACLTKALGDEEWVQFAVIEALSKIRDESSVVALVKALGSATDLVASMIVEALGQMGNIKAVTMLLRRMDSAPTALRNKIVKAIVDILGGKSLGLLSEAERAKFNDYLLVALADEDEDIQDAAVLGLGYLGGDKASSEILRLAGTMDPEAAQERLEAAVSALASIGLTPALRDSVAAGPHAEAMVAVEVLARIDGDKVSPMLMESFWNQERDLQREIVKALLRVGGPEAADFFMNVLSRHEDGTVLKAALYFLGQRLGAEEAGETVFAFLDHPYDDVKEAALEACVAMGGESMTARFREIYASADPLKRLMGVYALGRLGAREHLEELRQALEDEVPDIRKIALEALEGLLETDREVLALVMPRLSDENRDVRLTMVELLGRCRNSEALGYLMQALADDDDWVRVRAMEALSERRAREAVPSLVPFLVSQNKLVVLKAIEALGAIGGQAAFRALLDILASDDPEIQAAAEEAITQVQEEQDTLRQGEAS